MTDQWQSRQSRVFCGVFDSYERAEAAAIRNENELWKQTYVIVPTELNKFNEI